MAVLTHNEHCPPHVHVGTQKWDARFLFSFWHDGVRLWDLTPAQNEPTAAMLEDLRLALKQAANLRKARRLWWGSRQTLCLDNLMWDVDGEEAISPKVQRAKALAIEWSRFDERTYKTVLKLSGRTMPLEITL